MFIIVIMSYNYNMSYIRQERLFADIQSVVMDNTPVHVDDQRHLPYVCATLLEVQRLASVSCMTPPHKCVQTSGNVELLGYRIPHDAEVSLRGCCINSEQQYENIFHFEM